MIATQLDLFRELTPAGMWCTDDPEAYGQRCLPREAALKRRYIDPNPKGKVWAMVFDIDRPGAVRAWEDADMPVPNWAAQNPANGHAHLGYILDAPVSRSDASRGKPLRYLARIECAMTVALDADRAYSHRLTKNPIHPHWRTFWERGKPYELNELRDYLGEKLPLRISRKDAVGEGRNVTLFDGLRHWAYRNRLAYTDRNAWDRACLLRATSLNSFAHPLPLKEVMVIATSVSKWTWAKISHAGFSQVQARRGIKSGKKRGQHINREAILAAVFGGTHDE